MPFRVRGPLAALLLACSLPGQTLPHAIGDLARKIAAVTREPAVLSVHTLAPEAADPAQVRPALRAALERLGMRVVEPPAAVEVRVTISQNVSQQLLVAEVRRGEERVVLMAGWPRQARTARAPTVSLTRRLIREQAEPMLDVAMLDEQSFLVLEPGRVARYGKQEAAVSLTPARPLPRDPRGRIVVQGEVLLVYLPGTTCRGTVAPALALECKAGDTAWPVYSGAALAGHADFRPGRNFFEGPLNTTGGVYKRLPPFYSAALAGQTWVMAGLDGRAGLYNQALDPAGAVEGWGDVAGTELECGGSRYVLAARAGENGEEDAVVVLEINGGETAAASAPVEFAGPVTALWPAGKDGVVAIFKDVHTGRYAAYRLVPACGS